MADEKQVIDPKRLSASRLSTFTNCGLRFELQYVEGIQPGKRGTALLFGTVWHRAREQWCVDRSQDLRKLIADAWRAEAEEDKALGVFLKAYSPISSRARALEADILARRPDIKAPRMTKDWKTSQVARDISQLLAKHLKQLERDSKWAFTEKDPLPALWDESITLAAKYQAKFGHLPNALHSELQFEFEWNGYRLKGAIDEIAPVIDRATGEMLAYLIVDAKTAKKEAFDAKHTTQLTMYRVAFRHLIETGYLEDYDPNLPVVCAIDLPRLGEFEFFEIGPLQERLLVKNLERYELAVRHKVFIANPTSCFADNCEYIGECKVIHGLTKNDGRAATLGAQYLEAA